VKKCASLVRKAHQQLKHSVKQLKQRRKNNG
jgi:hypothetical protein